MTVEQYEKASKLGNEILRLKHMINLLTLPQLECKIIIEATHKEAKTYQKPIRELITDAEMRTAILEIIVDKRDELAKEFEEL